MHGHPGVALAVQPDTSDGWFDALGKVIAGEALLCHGVISQLATTLWMELVLLVAAASLAAFTLWYSQRGEVDRTAPRSLQYVARVMIVVLVGASTRPVITTWAHVAPLLLASVALTIAVTSPFILLAPSTPRRYR